MNGLVRRAALGLACALPLSACSNGDVEAPRHVLFLVCDTLRADHLSAWGHERETSPHIDSLAARGVRFSRAVSQCSWTAPSMISLMTGRYLADPRLKIPADVTTLAEIFQAGGYATHAFLSNPLLMEQYGFYRGFDQAQRLEPYAPDDPIVAWIESQKDARTFTYVHLNEPHDPYQPPPDWRNWGNDPPPLDAERLALYERLAPEQVNKEVLAEIRRGVGGYDDDVRYTDRRIGLFLDALERTGQLEDTAIVMTADHGEGLWTRFDFASNGPRASRRKNGEAPTLTTTFKMTHGNYVYTEQVHVPIVLTFPGLGEAARGRVIASRVENIDVVPTLLELCDLGDPGGLQGTSLLRAMEDQAAWRENKKYIYTATRFVCSVITQDGWQLMLPTDLGECREGLIVELYDLGSDPEARRNVAAEHPERVQELTAVCNARRASGIAATDEEPASPEDEQRRQNALRDLGYVGNGTADSLINNLTGEATAALLEILEDRKLDCVDRMFAARALATRELTEAQGVRLDAVLEAETSPGVLRPFGGAR